MNKRTRAIAEVTTVYILVGALYWSSRYFPDLLSWQQETFGRNIIVTFTGMILFPAAFMYFPSNTSKTENASGSLFKRALETGGRSLSVMMPVTFLSFPVVQLLGFSFYSWPGALIIAGWHFVAIPALCWLFRDQTASANRLPSRRWLGIILLTFAAGIPITAGLHALHPKAAQIFIALLFIGQAEEFLFRGYIQTRLNQVLDTRWSIFGFSFGWGLITASLLFELIHVIAAQSGWPWAWGFWTFAGGLCFGVIREKGGTFVASGLVHGIIMIFPVLFS
ncbi:CPBP family intramembrane glutamic endopeptidase [Gracilimonas mengyeensis]|uniref:CAAX protease self-immunity n=1 Tax=Gracilimonas mengyeensis TaxID=1302730 RepID=A0A521E5G0_9BACT|nr:CPBP family intramembrane glutamic endopeptidase [Gracilimonas mengyeensis]SMO79186.1 CAAX protease self-immunity [Gracilimonas mengyeensis]